MMFRQGDASVKVWYMAEEKSPKGRPGQMFKELRKHSTVQHPSSIGRSCATLLGEPAADDEGDRLGAAPTRHLGWLATSNKRVSNQDALTSVQRDLDACL
jgi:hypothetical protein